MRNQNKWLTQEELDVAFDFFSQSSIPVLTEVCTSSNIQQPLFSAIIFAWGKFGVPMDRMEELLESIFVIYYAHTEIRKQKLPQISVEVVSKNLLEFQSFIRYYNKETTLGQEAIAMTFLEDKIALRHAIESLGDAFDGIEHVPSEVICGYVALLKSVEQTVATVA